MFKTCFCKMVLEKIVLDDNFELVLYLIINFQFLFFTFFSIFMTELNTKKNVNTIQF